MTTNTGLWRLALGCLAGILLLSTVGLAGSARTQRGASAGIAPFTVIVLDQYGQPTENALVRTTYGWDRVEAARGYTNADGEAVLQLDPTLHYVVEVRYQGEYWCYDYIYQRDWPARAYRRRDPWIDEVSLSRDPCPVGFAQAISVTANHDYEHTSFDLRLRARLSVDDDGEAPYLYEDVSPIQYLYEGFSPFHFHYTPTVSGEYVVRAMLERRFESNHWVLADEGGWQWHFRAAANTPTPTVEPTIPPQPCTLSGTVFVDWDGNGEKEASEPSMSGVQVVLSTPEDVILESQWTDSAGGYGFEVTRGADYVVALGTLPSPYRGGEVQHVVSCEGGQVWDGLDLPIQGERLWVPLLRKP